MKKIFVLSFFLFLVGCASRQQDENDLNSEHPTELEEIPSSGSASPTTSSETPTTSATSNTTELKPSVYFFESASYKLSEKYLQHLHEQTILIVKTLLNNKSMRIIVAGYADNMGDDQMNFDLSAERANYVARFLRVRGIPLKNIEIISYGKSKPISNGTDPESLAQNRRVEIRFQ